ncbi:MAG TPA: flagellar motor switch protein FliM [Rugosimonospora sp.]|nr:flagellar motor switch protein FliM [Rugosimonospora sp.]
MARRTRKTGPQPYDFRRPIKLSREHIRMLQIAYETYARGCATLLTSRLRTLSSVTLLAIEQLTYDEYVETLSSPTMMCSITLDPLPGVALMELSLGTGMAAIDHLLGGPGGPQPQRPPTDLEMPLLRGILDRMLSEFKYAYESLVELAPALGTIEYNPQFVRTFAPSDAVVVASFEMRVGAEECVATICLPFNMILPVLQTGDADAELTASEADARRTAQINLTAGLESVPLGVSVRFLPVRMRAEDVVDLQIGDIVPLNHPVTQPLTITVNDNTFAYAVPGNQGKRLACLVVPAPTEETRR